ncbi:hypothetical protein QCA50_013487 [Cerrena zonata]|uniref:F-box domain-containing protein n=1 Tax=Cerrena zonata TaxID=2478898 RepID=A0AAW0FWF1_9APHY
MRHLASTTWNDWDDYFMHTDEPGTSASWSTAITKDFVVSSYAEGTACNDTSCAQRIEPKQDELSALPAVVSDCDRWIRNSILGALQSATTVYNRMTERYNRSGDGVEVTVGDRGHDLQCSSRLPTEIYEIIIDHVAVTVSGHYNRSDLARCARVCWAWVPRAQMHLFSSIVLLLPPVKQPIASFQRAVRQKRFLLQYIKAMTCSVEYTATRSRQMTLLTSYHMPNLKQCYISYLDLKTEHPSLSRFPSSATSLQKLELMYCNTGDVNQLCRFLTSFRSLSIVVITWPLDPAFRGHDLPHLQFNRSKCSLRTLALGFTPNLSPLLKSFIKARPFISHLRHLIVPCERFTTASSSLQDTTELLEHCSQSLEEVTVIVGHVVMAKFDSLSSFSFSLEPQLSVTERKLFTDDVGCLDEILSGEMFRSFRKLRIRADIVTPTELPFPKLKERKVDVDVSDKDDPIPF